MSRPRLSACTYTFNNEAVVEGCLRSLAFADEVVLVDSGSTDRTVEIARTLGATVHTRPWTGFRDQLEHIGKMATGDWVLVADADERVPPELAREVRAAIDAGSRFDAFRIPRRTRYLGRWLRHGEWYPDYVHRLYRRGKGRYEREPHALLRVDGPVGTLRNPLEHLGYRDLSEQLDKIQQYSTWGAGELLERGCRWPVVRALVHPPLRFLKGYLLRAGFLDGLPGFVVCVMTSYHVFVKYMKVWELRRRGNGTPTA